MAKKQQQSKKKQSKSTTTKTKAELLELLKKEQQELAEWKETVEKLNDALALIVHESNVILEEQPSEGMPKFKVEYRPRRSFWNVIFNADKVSKELHDYRNRLIEINRRALNTMFHYVEDAP